MQNYQQFWNDEISQEGQGQLVVDWDLFISNFTDAVHRHINYRLNSIQKEFIKGKIDPLNTNQIYKNAFLLFSKHYWDLPSNRTNLFKMKMNLSTIPRLNLMVGSETQTISIKFRWNNQQKRLSQVSFLYKQNKLHELDSKGLEISQKNVIQNGFISFGASQKNDIVIQDCIFLNKHHFKLTSLKKEIKVKKKSIFDQKEPAPLILTEWFIRDTSKSNRICYQLNNPYKYVILKPGMVLNFGFTNNYELRIVKVGYNTGNIPISSKAVEEMGKLLNTDRINFMGEIDPKIPLKTVLDFDFQEMNPKDIEQLYLQGQYYPNTREQVDDKKGASDKNVSSLIFQIVNKRTFEVQQFSSANQTNFIVGRAQQSHFRIDDISVRSKQLIFQSIANIWTVKNAQEQPNNTLQRHFCGVNLASLRNIEERRSSNRISLKQGYPYIIRGRQFQCEIDLRQPKNDQLDF